MKNKISLRFLRCALAGLLCISLIALIVSPLSLAWFYDTKSDHPFEGKAWIGYFKSGSGSSDDEYIISTAAHFYNLAWLQYLGKIEDGTYFKVIPEEGNVLDMAGMLAGEEGVSGAIPPIGTTEHPFRGNFNGNGVVIKNLWVSTNPDDWYERPVTYGEHSVGTDIGLFGKVELGADIQNFFVENLEVTTTTGEAVTLGILAGSVNGDIKNVGVKNAKLSFREKGASVTSDFTLVGFKHEYVIWDDFPTNEGEGGTGDLIIIPTFDTGSKNINTIREPTGNTIPGSAYFVPNMTITKASPPPSGTYVFKSQKVEFPANLSQTKVTYTADTSTATDDVAADELEQEYWDMIGSAAPQILSPSAAPNFSAVQSNSDYPSNCVWFKPVQPGDCAIAFIRQDNSGPNYMSIYRYTRSNGKVQNLQEVELELLKKNGIGNGGIIYFPLEITQAEIDAQYEYVIGKSTGRSSTAGFIFLKLAGTDTSSGGGNLDPDGNPYRKLENIDFVKDTNVDILSEDFEMHRSHLTITGVESGTGALYFDVNSSDRIYYCVDSTLTVSQKLNGTTEHPIEADKTTDPNEFPKREETAPENTVP